MAITRLTESRQAVVALPIMTGYKSIPDSSTA